MAQSQFHRTASKVTHYAWWKKGCALMIRLMMISKKLTCTNGQNAHMKSGRFQRCKRAAWNLPEYKLIAIFFLENTSIIWKMWLSYLCNVYTYIFILQEYNSGTYWNGMANKAIITSARAKFAMNKFVFVRIRRETCNILFDTSFIFNEWNWNV